MAETPTISGSPSISGTPTISGPPTRKGFPPKVGLGFESEPPTCAAPVSGILLILLVIYSTFENIIQFPIQC
jgi:hypothetical protein